MCKNWPDSFDFDQDEICQAQFKPFIEKELAKLEEYGRQRPSDTLYVFHEHAQRVATDVKNTCLHMNLSDNVANNMYWALLPHDIGKRKLPVEIWDTEDKPSEYLKHKRRSHTDLGATIVEERFPEMEHPFKDLMVEIMLNHHEQMNGQGYRGLMAEDLSLPVRLAAIVEAYDGWKIWRPHYGERDISIPGVLERMREEKGPDFFDMELLETFADMKMMESENQS